MKWLDSLERRLSRFRIPAFYQYIVLTMGAVFLLDFLMPFSVSSALSLNMSRVARGEVWRLITFIFLPPSDSLFFALIALYFYYMLGGALEARWGARRFLIYYVFGVLGAILAALLTGYGTNTFLNLSIFLAFAAMNPDFSVMLFFFLPVKIKWIALFDLALYAYYLIVGTWSTRVTIILSLLNVILFFGPDALAWGKLMIGNLVRRYRMRR